MTDGFANELAVAWPILSRGIGDPVIVSVGSARHVKLEPTRMFRYAVRFGAQGVILAHNHPLGTGPSAADRAVTRRLVAAGLVLGIPLVAHLVVEPDNAHELVAGVELGGDTAVSVPRTG